MFVGNLLLGLREGRKPMAIFTMLSCFECCILGDRSMERSKVYRQWRYVAKAIRWSILLAICLSFFLLPSMAVSAEQGGLAIDVNGLKIDLSLFSIFVLPEDRLEIEVEGDPDGVTFQFGDQQLLKPSARGWATIVPSTPGIYTLVGRNSKTGSSIRLNIFVLVPSELVQGGLLTGYRIGEYPKPLVKRGTNYSNPKGFIRVDRKNQDILLTPHFRLSQFLCKQKSGYPKYAAVQERLLILLERLLGEVQRQGIEIETFGFISGYRTPFYNQKIKNVAHSRHIYGDAADIYLDANRDGKMDDLNGDEIIDRAEAERFFSIANSLFTSHAGDMPQGGVGKYGPNKKHSGFIHIDARGFRARW